MLRIRYIVNKLTTSSGFFLLLLFLVCPFIFQVLLKPEDCIYQYTLNLLTNVSFGYIAGYIFYFVSDFLPNIKREFDALQKILYAEYEILTATSILELYKLSISKTKYKYEFEFENKEFVEMICENNPFKQCKDEGIRVMSYWQIRNEFVSLTRIFMKNSSTYFDLLMSSQSKYLSYEEIESITKLKHCLCLDYADQKEGVFYARLFDINTAFYDFYFNQDYIKKQLKAKAKYCIDKKLKDNIDRIQL